jgi:N-acetylglutamate synthase-like GNAT family acetyltransferase
LSHRMRRAVSEDAAELTRLMHASAAYQGAYAIILNGYSVTAEQVVADQVYLVEEAGEIVGFYSLTNIVGDPELDLLFVADYAQGKGIGAVLIKHMRKLAGSLGIHTVRIVAHPPAEHSYVRMGAHPIGVKAPSGRVTWSRPILAMSIQTPGNR